MDDSAILETIRRHTAGVLPDIDPAQITVDRRLDDLGCNSVDRADIWTGTLEELNVPVPLNEFPGEATIGELVRLVREHS